MRWPTLYRLYGLAAVLVSITLLSCGCCITLVAHALRPAEAGFDAAGEALRFLEQVVGLNVSAYDVSIYVNEYTVPVSHVRQEVDVILNATNSEVHAFVEFVDGRFVGHILWIIRGAPSMSLEYPPDVLSAVEDFLDRYVNAFDAAYCTEFIETLQELPNLENTTLDKGNYTLKIEVYSERASLTWTYKSPSLGIEVERKQLSLGVMLDVGNLVRSMIDEWELYKIGSEEVRVSREEAIEIAYETARSFIEERGATVVEERASLHMKPRNDNYTLYPVWFVELYFDRIYEDGIYGYEVWVWADTGEVMYDVPMGMFGQVSPSQHLSGAILLPVEGVVALIAVALAVGTVMTLHRRRKVMARKPRRRMR